MHGRANFHARIDIRRRLVRQEFAALDPSDIRRAKLADEEVNRLESLVREAGQK